MKQSRLALHAATIGGLVLTTSGTRVATSLSSDYTHHTSGAAVALRYMAQTADPIDEVYVFLDNVGGTLGSVTVEAKIYNENTATRPGSTLRATSTATTMPGSVDKWIKIAFGTPYTPAVGEIVWIVIYNTSVSPGTDYPQILTAITSSVSSIGGVGILAGLTTSNGFATNGSNNIEMPCVIKQGSSVIGQPFTQTTTSYFSSNQLARGIVVDPLNIGVKVSGVIWNNVGSAFSNLKIFDGVTGPGGTPLHDFDLDSDTNETTNDLCGGKVFDSEVTLSAGSEYKAVLTFGANSALPAVAQIEGYSDYSSLFDTLRGDSSMFFPWGCIDNGAGGWTILKDICPVMGLVINDIPIVSAGSGHIRARESI